MPLPVRAHVGRAGPAGWSVPVPPLRLRRPVDLGRGLLVAADPHDTPSIRGATAGGAWVPRAVLRALGPDQRGAA
ncbi:hypothetical protein ACU610_03665 [Geodermatophilus sp. URMC 61]|uniref:hypothetical protein n=1 Tax=Geodermatophilus sp. URMC 61 TaxID=3423411 RepID=UPI00406C2A72